MHVQYIKYTLSIHMTYSIKWQRKRRIYCQRHVLYENSSKCRLSFLRVSIRGLFITINFDDKMRILPHGRSQSWVVSRFLLEMLSVMNWYRFCVTDSSESCNLLVSFAADSESKLTSHFVHSSWIFNRYARIMLSREHIYVSRQYDSHLSIENSFYFHITMTHQIDRL